MFLECQYNGKELYSNKWDLCTVEEGTGDQVIFCPIAPGKHKFVKDLDIPNYLPKVSRFDMLIIALLVLDWDGIIIINGELRPWDTLTSFKILVIVI